MPPGFVHLHVHSEYSLTDSTIRIAGLVGACVEAGMPAVALTDQSNLFALVKFYKAAEAAGIKPIAGCDLWIADPEDRSQPQRLTVLCQDRDGYLNLSRLISRAYAAKSPWRSCARGIRVVRRRECGPDRAGRPAQRCRTPAARGRAPTLRAHAPSGGARGSAIAITSKPHASRERDEDAFLATALDLRRALRPAGRGQQRRALSRARRLRGARSARMHPRGPRARRSEAPARLQRPSST